MSNELDIAFDAWLAGPDEGAVLARQVVELKGQSKVALQLIRLGFICGMTQGMDRINKIVQGSQQQAGAA